MYNLIRDDEIPKITDEILKEFQEEHYGYPGLKLDSLNDKYTFVIQNIINNLTNRKEAIIEAIRKDIKESVKKEIKDESSRILEAIEKEAEERKKIIKSACIYKYEYDINYELEMQGLINKHFTEDKLFVVDNETVDESLQDLKADIILRLTEANRQIVKSIVERFKSRQKL